MKFRNRMDSLLYREQKLQEVIYHYARNETNWDLRLAAVELLAAWNIDKAKKLMTEERTRIYHRSITIELPF